MLFKNQLTLHISLILFVLTTSSCSLMKARVYSDAQSQAFHHKISNQKDYYRISPESYLTHYDSLRQAQPLAFQEITQPMQIIVFDKSGNNTAHLVNCNVGGLPLKWNRTGSFDHYPIVARGLREPEYKVSLETLEKYIEPSLDITQILASHDHLYVIIYTKAFHVLAKSFYKNIRHHADKFSSENVKYIYVNAEDLYVHLDSQQKMSKQ